MEIAGSTIVVTGGASGIGRALCQRFAADGAAHVIVADLDGEGARAVADEIGGHPATLDVRDGAAVEALVDQVERDHAPIDLFCSNAGILQVGGLEVPDDRWQLLWDVNLMAHVHAARAMVPRMIDRGHGYLLQTASAAGLLNQIGAAPYAVTKHAAIGLAEWLSITFGDHGIRVSVLCPQAVRTPMLGDHADGSVAGLDGVAEPDDVARIVVEGLADERFLILPHPSVATYVEHKGTNYERWLAGMRKLQAKFFEAPDTPPACLLTDRQHPNP